MSVEQLACVVVLVGVLGYVGLFLFTAEKEHNLILKQNVLDLKKRYDEAYEQFEAACIQADNARASNQKNDFFGRRLRAHDNYMYWQRVFRQHRAAAEKAGIKIPGIC